MTDARLLVQIVDMRGLELQITEQTASKLQEAAERLRVSPEQLAIVSIEAKLAQLEEEFGAQRFTCFGKTPISITDFPDAAVRQASLDWTEA